VGCKGRGENDNERANEDSAAPTSDHGMEVEKIERK
jgi:hypothetical protein